MAISKRNTHGAQIKRRQKYFCCCCNWRNVQKCWIRKTRGRRCTVLGNWRRTVGIVGNVVCFAFQATKATKHTAIQAQTQAQMRLPASRYESERCTERKAAQLANLFPYFI